MGQNVRTGKNTQQQFCQFRYVIKHVMPTLRMKSILLWTAKDRQAHVLVAGFTNCRSDRFVSKDRPVGPAFDGSWKPGDFEEVK